MEEEKYTVYDLETPTELKTSNPSDQADNAENPDHAENPTPHSKAEEELTQMVNDMGAEKALDILKGNRNSAIEQILTELESGADRCLQSGTSAAVGCCSIFDLAAMA